MQGRNRIKYVGVLPQKIIQTLDARQLAPQTAVIAVRDKDILHALRDDKKEKGINLPLEFWQTLPEKLRTPDAILFDHQQKHPTLLFVYKTDQGKLAVKMDYEVKIKDKVTKKKEKVKLNLVRTGSIIQDTEKSWESMKAFELLWGSLD